MTPTRVVIHNTANDASARNEISYMTNNNRRVSFHYAVDDKETIQAIPENRNAWHAGDGTNGTGNRQGIGIEICYSKSGGSRFNKAEKNAVRLTSNILKKYGWGIDRVTKHQDYSGKYCPRRTLDMGWDRFLNMVEREIGAIVVKISKGVPVETNNQWHPAIGQAVVVEQRNNNTETRIKASDWFDQWVPTYKLEILNRELDTKALESNIRRVAELEKLVKEKGKNLKKAQDLASERAKGLKIKDKELERLSKELKIRKAYIDQIYKLYTV